MARPICSVVTLGILAFAGMFLMSSTGSAAPASVNVNGKIYYIVNGNDPTMDTGAEVCASVGKICKEYGTIATNAVCVKFHPTARAMSMLDGSKAEFFCDGAPQTGVCGNPNMKNVCGVCPKCNLNEASTCNQPIGRHFREMYVECATPLIRKSSSSKKYSSSRRSSSKHSSSVRRSSSSRSGRSSSQRVIYTPPTRAGTYGPLPVPGIPTGGDPRIGTYPGKVICEFYQMANPGDYAKSNKKLVTCAAYRAADQYCTIAMQSQYARAERCDENGIVICSNPCKPPTYQLPISRCAFDNDRPRGSQAAPLSFCGSSSKAASVPAKKNAGQQCRNGGDCTSGMCLGVVPGQYYVCSCIDPATRWQSCNK